MAGTKAGALGKWSVPVIDTEFTFWKMAGVLEMDGGNVCTLL